MQVVGHVHPWPARAVRRARIPALLALAALIALAAGGAQAALFNPQTFTLDNGMQVVVVPDRRVPVVSHMVWYKVGAADEEPGRSGLAHLLEHLMFKGTPQVPQGAFSREVARNGGQENAFTSYDYTAFFQNIASDRLELVMRMEADRMANLVLTDEQVTPERQVVLEERRMRVDNDPAAILDEEAQAVRFLNHPYHRPIIGWESEIEGLTTADALAFYRRWYAPNNAILVVTGDVDADTLRPLAERTYGKIPRTDVPARNDLVEPEPRAQRQVTLSDPRVAQPAWSRSWLAPSYRHGDGNQAYPLQVLAEVLGGGATTPLYRRLVVERSLAVSADAWYEPSRRGPASFIITASPRPGVSLDQLGEATQALVDEVIKADLTDTEVERAKSRMLANAVFARDSFATAARVIGEALAIGQSIDEVEAWPDRIASVTREQVEAAARLVLKAPPVTSLLMTAPGAAPPVATTGGGRAVPAAIR